MGKYGEAFSKVQSHFLRAIILAKNNEKDISGIAINAFSEPFIVPREMFDVIANMTSVFEVEGGRWDHGNEQEKTGNDATNKKRRSGFDAPAIGTIYPKGSKIVKMPNGRIKIVPPCAEKDNKEKKKQ